MTSCRHTWHHGRKISHFQSSCRSELLLGVVLLEVVKNICCVKRSHRVVDYLDERNCDSREGGEGVRGREGEEVRGWKGGREGGREEGREGGERRKDRGGKQME